MNKKLLSFFLITSSCVVLLTGCVAGKTYRSHVPAEVVMPSPTPRTATRTIPSGLPCHPTLATDFKQPCIAYIEFDDQGELRVAPGDMDGLGLQKEGTQQANCSDGGGGRVPTQVDVAKELICAAMKPAEGELTQPIVMVFVHGWKHNAAQRPAEDANVQGLKDFLDEFRRLYPDTWVRQNTQIPCVQGSSDCKLLRHPVVGIYIAWRGESISHYFPVARTFSVFSRQSAAYRVGNTSLTDAITEISAVAHPLHSDTDPYQPFLLMMGHSFGGLILERTLAQALMERLDDPANAHTHYNSEHKPTSSFADLVVYVNTAVAASDSKQIIDLLARHETEEGILNTPNNPGAAGQVGKRYPQIVSLSSVDDQATLSLITVGHALPALGRKIMGSARSHVPLLCYEPQTRAAGRIDDFSQTDFYLHTAPHFEAMQSHELKVLPRAECTVSAFDSRPNTAALKKLGEPREAAELTEWLEDSFGPTPVMDNSCYVIVPKNSIVEPGKKVSSTNLRCNGTPYFVMEVPHAIIPDHGTIFTQRHLQLLSVFLPQTVDSTTAPGQPQRGVIMKRELKPQ